MIPLDWQGRLKIDYMRHLGAGLIKKWRQKQKAEIKEMQKERKCKPDS